MNEPRYYAPDGTPLSLMEYALLFEQREADLSKDSWWRRVTDIDHGRMTACARAAHQRVNPGSRQHRPRRPTTPPSTATEPRKARKV